MGAYLSQPKTDKVSTDEFNSYLEVGASSMQGWRNSQEDAHNCILSYDENTSLFAVYDGHGGAEVATYCADKLPEFLKGLDAYKINNFEKALKDGFLGFDKTLLEPKTIESLKILADEKNFVECCDDGADEDEEDACMDDLAELREESDLPLDAVLEKYKTGNVREDFLKKVKDSSASKPQSPYLRGRRAAAVAADAANKAVMDPDAKPQGSSTSAAAAAAAAAFSAFDDAGPSSSKSGISKMDTEEPEEDSTVSSSSSSASKTNSNNNAASIEANKNENSTVAAAATTATVTATAAAAHTEANITTNGADASTTTATSAKLKAADSSHVKEIEQNGSVTSSEAKPTKGDVSTSATASDATVSGSNEAAKKIQNGTVGSSSATSSSAGGGKNAAHIERSAISSTSKEAKNAKKDAAFGEEDSTDDDYDVENSADERDANHEAEYSSDEDVEEDTDGEGEEDEEADTEEEEEEVEEDEDEALANEEFCANMIEEPGKDSGCTAVVALLRGRDLYVANAGDSRCVVCRKGEAIDMSLDHKPEDEEESSRIVKAGGRVTLDGRVNGGLNLSRAIGDHAYKMNLHLPAEEQMISALPDIKKLIITPDDEFMILACDGIWNYMSSDDVVHFVRLRLKDESKKISEICEELFETCLAPNTMGDGTGCDNMTAVIIRFQPELLELPTTIDPNETEDVLAEKQATTTQGNVDGVSSQKSFKRSASPTSDDNSNETEENANKTKRLKTDQDLSSSTNTTNTNNSSNTITTSNKALSSSNDAASSTDSTSPVVTATTNEQKECDTVSNEAALSST